MNQLTQADFQERRTALAHQMGANSIAIITTNLIAYRNNDADYKYRPDSSFYYLTGFAEPEAVAVIETFETPEEYTYSLFCRERDRDMEIWNGYRAGIDGAVDDYDADEAYAIDLLDEEILPKLAHKEKVFYRIGHQEEFDARVARWIKQVEGQARRGVEAPTVLVQLDKIIDEMRVIKSQKEIEMMKFAAEVSAKAHTRAMQTVQPNMMEYALEAELNYIFGQVGGVPAYNSIVGGGKNACILHYVENNQPLKAGDLVLIDAGCESQYYAADITRTFPVSGRFTPEQKALYEVVLKAQYAAIDVARVGNQYTQMHQVAVQILTQGLVDLGLLEGDVDELISDEAYRQFYMHGTGHWLGLDVHDVGAYKLSGTPRVLEVGMVVTVEPGLYIAPDDESVDEKWRGIGIRIEDDVVITADEPYVLTQNVVKDIKDIEALMGQE